MDSDNTPDVSRVCGIEETAVNTWREFRNYADHVDLSPRFKVGLLFRGHADYSWPLASTLHRSATNDGARPMPNERDLLDLERELVGVFKQQAPGLMHPNIYQMLHADFDWWTVMRHVGAPTRLLDWTRSFHVAAYFACASQSARDGCIWVLVPDRLDAAMSALHGASAKLHASMVQQATTTIGGPPVIHVVERASALDDRMVAQQGLFMLPMNVATDVGATLSSLRPGGDNIATKVRIQATLKPEIMRRLRAMNVTGASLFPGLDGIGRALHEITRFP